MFCSTIIPTIGRATLSRAVQSVLDQSFTAEDFEVIVVSDSGKPLPEESWQESPRVRIIETNRRERCVARNTGAAIAKGRYLHFLDDDDWLLPGALQAFAALAHASPAAWLAGACQHVNANGEVLATEHLNASGNALVQVLSPGQWMPLQSSLIDREAFFAAGGFHPSLLATQDIHLCRQIALRGELAATPVAVACMLRGIGWHSTTDYEHAVQYYRLGREINLSESGVFERLLTSATTGFWRGRVVRIFLASAAWNLRQKRLFAAASRTSFGLASFVLAGRQIVSGEFWRGATAGPIGNWERR